MVYEIPAHYKVIATEVFTAGEKPGHPAGRTLRTGDPRAGDHPTAALFTVEDASVKVSLAYPRPEHYEAKPGILSGVYRSTFASDTTIARNELQINTDQQRIELRTFIAGSPTEAQYTAAENVIRTFIEGTKSIGLGKVDTAATPDELDDMGQYKGYFHLDGEGGGTAFTMERSTRGLKVVFVGGIRGGVVIPDDDTVWLIPYTTDDVQVYDSAFDGHRLFDSQADRRSIFIEGREKLLRTGLARNGASDATVAVTYFA